jgi:hypothetical protein
MLCEGAMSSLLHQEVREGRVIEVLITRGGTSINYLFFANDSLMFCRANLHTWGKLQAILDSYEAALGQKINRDKTLIFFSRITIENARHIILNEARVSATFRYEKYLGLPPLIGRSRVSTFNSIKNRIWNSINGWNERFLSHAGK